MEPLTKDRKDRWTGAVVASVLGALAFALSRTLPLVPDFAEALLGDGRAALPARVLTRVSALVPFSVGEVLLGVYAVWIAVLCLRSVPAIRRRDVTLGEALRGGARRLLLHAGVVVAGFYILWGFNYARPSLAERAEWPEWVEPTVEELSQLTRAAVLEANVSYLQLHGSLDSGSATSFPSDVGALERAMRDGSQRALNFLPEGQSAGRGMPKTRVKRPWSTGVFARLGGAGAFFPFTAE